MNSGIVGFSNHAKSETPVESRLASGLNALGAHAGRLSMCAERLSRITGRIAGFEPEAPSKNEKGGPTPVDCHLSKFHRISGEMNDALDRLERQLCKLEENVG